MYRIVLSCLGIPQAAGEAAAADVADEFSHRPWSRDVRCWWDGACLQLQADSDHDADGRALADEFSDAIAACVAGEFDSRITIDSVTVIAQR